MKNHNNPFGHNFRFRNDVFMFERIVDLQIEQAFAELKALLLKSRLRTFQLSRVRSGAFLP